MSSQDDQQKIPLSASSIECLLQKFTEEIEDLEQAVRNEDPSNVELCAQLSDAVQQSKELREELKIVHRMFLDVVESKRTFTGDEVAALQYFGFSVTPGWVPSSESVGKKPEREGYLNLPSRRSLSARRDATSPDFNETETDVMDVITRRSADREPTPEYFHLSSPSTTSSSKHKKQQLATFTSTPQRAGDVGSPPATTPLAVQQQRQVAGSTHQRHQRTPSLETFTVNSRGNLEDATYRAHRDALEKEWQQEKRELLLAADEKIVALQQDLISLQQRAAEEADALRRSCDEEKKLLQQRSNKMEAEHRQELRSLLDLSEKHVNRHEAEVNGMKDALRHEQLRNEALSKEVAALKLQLKEAAASLKAAEVNQSNSIIKGQEEFSSLVRAVMDVEHNRLLSERDELMALAQELDQQLNSKLDSMRGQHQGTLLKLKAAPPSVSFADVEGAIESFASLREAAHKTYTYNLGSCSDADETDDAVTQLLNSIGFPFMIPIRRLGKGGDYFIDRRVHIKLTNGQVVVRPRQPSQTTSAPNPYEHLAKYLVHLYAPLLDLELPHGGESPATAESSSSPQHHLDLDGLTAEESRRVELLQRQRIALQRSLREHQQEAVADNHVWREAAHSASDNKVFHKISFTDSALAPGEVDPSLARRKDVPADYPATDRWRRPPSPSPVPDAPPDEPPRPSTALIDTRVSQKKQQRDDLLTDATALNERLRKGQQEFLKKSTAQLVAKSTETSAAATPGSSRSSSATTAKKRFPDLSQLSSEELEQLKRAALAQQVREMKRLTSQAARR